MCLKGHFTGAGVRGGALLRPRSPPVLLPAPLLSLEEGQGHSPDLDLPWAALEVPVRDWGFARSPGAGQLPVLGTWIYGPTAATLPGALRGD